MFETLIHNLSELDTEGAVLLVVFLLVCFWMIFFPRSLRELNAALSEVFGSRMIEGHPLNSLLCYRIIGLSVLAFLSFAFALAKDDPETMSPHEWYRPTEFESEERR